MIVRAPGVWWDCFVCGSDKLCAHREPELISWVQSNAAGVARGLATAPPAALSLVRKPSSVAASAAAGAQLELFALERRAR
jgi:hypothetical protein